MRALSVMRTALGTLRRLKLSVKKPLTEPWVCPGAARGEWYERNAKLGAYQSVSAHGGVASDDPHRLVLMLMYGALDRMALARGFLAGNRSRAEKGETTRAKSDDFAHKLYYQESDFRIVDRVTEVAQARGVSNAQIAMAWQFQRPGITAPIIGATKPHHLEEAVKAEALHLTIEEVKRLEEPYQPHPVLGM